MVAILQFVAPSLLFASQVLAAPGDSNALNDLLKRQNSDSVPAQCNADCDTINTKIGACNSPACVCVDSNIAALGQCLNCAVSVDNSEQNIKEKQTVIDDIVTGCKDAGSPVSEFTVTPKTPEREKAGAIRTGAMSAAVAIACAILGAVFTAHTI